MTTQSTPNRCRHIFTAGRQCGSPSLRHDTFCYYHHTARMPAPVSPHRFGATLVEDFDFPLPEDRDAVQRGIGEVLRRIAAGRIDAKQAGLLLYGLALASNNLPRAVAAPAQEPLIEPTELITEVIMDEQLGILAPIPGETLEPTQTRTTPARFRKAAEDAVSRAQDDEMAAIERDSAQRAAARAASRAALAVNIPPSCFASPEQLRAQLRDRVSRR